MLATRIVPGICSRRAAAQVPKPLSAPTLASHQPRSTRLSASSPDSSTSAVVDPSASNGNGNGATSRAAAATTQQQQQQQQQSSIPTTPAAAGAASAPYQPSAAAVAATKLELLSELAALNRGTLATPAQKDRVEGLVRSLEASGAGVEPFAGSPAPVEGRWELVYNSNAVFTASPFFPAFQNGLVQDQQMAQAIFAFTDAIPGAEIGTALQTVSLLSNSLISEVDMAVFPGITGTVVTSSRLQVLSPTRLGLDVQSTRVANSSFSPFLDGISVPVEQLMEAVRGAGVTRVIYDVTFVDDSLRVTRCGDQLLLHRRV